MFKFFTDPKWYLWAWAGSALILSSLWVQVQIDVKINEWFGEFYDMIQKALGEPNAITISEYWGSLFSFITLAGIYVALAVAVSFFTAHFLFRWRTAMVECIILGSTRTRGSLAKGSRRYNVFANNGRSRYKLY